MKHLSSQAKLENLPPVQRQMYKFTARIFQGKQLASGNRKSCMNLVPCVSASLCCRFLFPSGPQRSVGPSVRDAAVQR